MVTELRAPVGFHGWPDCEVCGEPLTLDNGVLEVNRQRALALHYERRDRETDTAIAEREAGYTLAISLADVPLPEYAHWRWSHNGCGTDDGFDYWIPTRKLDTYAKVIGRTIHLSSKRWFPSSAWWGAIGRAWRIDC